MNEQNNGQGDNNKKNRQPFYVLGFLVLLALFFTSMMYRTSTSSESKEISYTEFMDLVEDNQVESVNFESDIIYATLISDTSYKADDATTQLTQAYAQSAGINSQITVYTAYINDDDLIPTLKEHNVDISGTISDSTAAIIYNILSFIIPLVLLWVIFGFLMRRMGGGAMGVGKSNAKVYNMEKTTGVSFKDVAGQDEAKESLQEMVDFLHNPKKYTEIGAKLPKGALLVGPPGTGKTLLAKAVAGEAGVPFFSLAGSDFVEMFVGVGASRVRDLFKEAQKVAPCIVFIDEIDAIGKSRDSHYGGSNDEREQTLNQLLAEMDGFDTNKGLLILAATNRPEVLDKALLRPGRFDRRIIVDRPDQKGRLETLKVHAKDVNMDETVDLDALALASAGLVGSDLANIINEAAILAVKDKRKFVSQKDLFEAFELVAVGGKEKKDRAMSEKERRTVSYHEVGHALVSALQKESEPVQKITIVPRTMGALGYTLQTPEEEKFLETKEELIAKIVTYMGGRAAEEIKFGSYTSGAANDIEQATKIARAMVTRFGMSDKFGMMGLATVESQYLEGRASLNCGEQTAAEIDEEVLRIITDAYNKAKKYLEENMECLDQISEYLFEHETITGKEFMSIFRKIKGIPEPEDEKKADNSSSAAETTTSTAEVSTAAAQDVVVPSATETAEQTSADKAPVSDVDQVQNTIISDDIFDE